jgi:hypothetical protein
MGAARAFMPPLAPMVHLQVRLVCTPITY